MLSRKEAEWQSFKDKEGNALPVWLKAAGYNTALIGKYLNGYGKVKPGGAQQNAMRPVLAEPSMRKGEPPRRARSTIASPC